MRGPRNMNVVSAGVGISLGAAIAPAFAFGDAQATSLTSRLLSSTAITSSLDTALQGVAVAAIAEGPRMTVASLGEAVQGERIEVAPQYTRFGFDDAGRAVVDGRAAAKAIVSVQLDGVTVATAVAADTGLCLNRPMNATGLRVERIYVALGSPHVDASADDRGLRAG